MTQNRKTRKFGNLPGAAFGLAGWALFIMAAASPTSTPKIAVLDTAKITSDSRLVQQAIDKASVGAEGIRQSLAQKQKEYQSAMEKYSSQKGVASEAENKKRADQLRTLKDEMEEMTFRLNREFKKAQEQAVAPMRDQIVKAVKDVSKAQGISIVMNADNVIYYDPGTDLTAAVVKKLDGK